MAKKKRKSTRKKTARNHRKTARKRRKTARKRRPIVLVLGKIHRKKGKRTKRALKKDRGLTALGPGKRRSKNGNIYYEFRVNRAD